LQNAFSFARLQGCFSEVANKRGVMSQQVPKLGGVSKGGKGSFLQESIAELKKVHAPTRQETFEATVRTLAILFLFAVVLAFLDWVFRGLMWQVV
jgi:preprotein translocase SecE subunit